MKFGHRILVHGPTRVRDIDLDASRADRQAIHEQVVLRAHLERLLKTSPFDGSCIEIRSECDEEAPS